MALQLKKLTEYSPYSRQCVDNKDIAEVIKVLKNNYITQGPEILKFEKYFAKYVGSEYAIACSSGTAALHISCLSLGINNRHKVITSPITFVASANCGEFVGAKTHFVDIDSDTYCISIESLEKKLKKIKVKLVIVVHMGGHSAEMEKIYRLKKKYKFYIIEDSCHALGGKYKGKNIGSCYYSDLSTFSFHPVKPITTGEGGMITTNNKDLYNKLLTYRAHGMHKIQNKFINKNLAFDKDKKINRWYYEIKDLGYNYRITDFQAALGRSQLKKINLFTKKRNKISNLYNKGFKDNELIKTPLVKKNVKHTFHLYTLLINYKKLKKSRNRIMEELARINIGTQVLYIPLFLQPYYKKKYSYKISNYKNSMDYYSKAISIPIYPNLKKREVNFIIDKINNIIKT